MLANRQGEPALFAENAPVMFYVVRHGRTRYNEEHRVQGWCDSPLTEAGVSGARALGAGLAGIDFLRAYSSDAGRAEHTRDELQSSQMAAREDRSIQAACRHARKDAFSCAALQPPTFSDPRLREWCYGDLEGRPGTELRATLVRGFGRDVPFAELNTLLPQVADHLADADTSGRAERFEAVRMRLESFFDEAGAEALSAGGGNVLVVTHSFVVRSLVYLLDPARINDPVRYENASVTRLSFDGGSFALGEISSTTWS